MGKTDWSQGNQVTLKMALIIQEHFAFEMFMSDSC